MSASGYSTTMRPGLDRYSMRTLRSYPEGNSTLRRPLKYRETRSNFDCKLDQQDTSASAAGHCQSKPEVYFKATAAEVTAAVESLYTDRLKPFGRILLKRVREQYARKISEQNRESDPEAPAVDVESVPLIEPKALRRLCESCQNLHVEAEDGKEYSVLLEGRPQDFVEVCSPDDIYSEAMWQEASDYLESLPNDKMLLPGGRYACAQVLLSRNLPWLKNRSLGEVCHIVQLAVSQKRLLGYLDGNMVPFNRSVDWIKEQCARQSQPVVFSSKKEVASSLPLASWEEARSALWNILDTNAAPGQLGSITLSNVKRLFRSRFGLELSETALGYSRLNELLQDSRLSDICSLEVQGKSQTVVQKAPKPEPAPMQMQVTLPMPPPPMPEMICLQDMAPSPMQAIPIDMGSMQIMPQPTLYDECWQAVPVAPMPAPWAPYPMEQAVDMMVPCMAPIPWEAQPPINEPSCGFMHCADGGYCGNPDFAPDMGAFPPYGRRSSKEILSEYLEQLLEHQHMTDRPPVQDVTGHVLQALCSPPPKAHKGRRFDGPGMGRPIGVRDRDHHGGSSVSTAASSAGDRRISSS
mmetsp:Transcript_75788/g.157979  ORF Transcript_75788/g.157979 Transcript_75788/m.157979 type:complete len:580 (+) Transcript_75788:346-2085(+)